MFRSQILGFILSLTLVTLIQAEELRLVEWGYLEPYREQLQQHLVQQGHDVTLIVRPQVISQAGDAFQVLRDHQADLVVGSAHFFTSNNQRLMRYALPIDVARLRNYQGINAEIIEQRFDYKKGQRFSVPLAGGRLMLMLRRGVVKPDLKVGWDLLWQESLSNNYLINCTDFEASVFMAQLSLGQELAGLGELHAFRDQKMVAELQQRINNLVRNSQKLIDYWNYSELDLASVAAVLTWGEGINQKHLQDWYIWRGNKAQVGVLDVLVVSPQLSKNEKLLAAVYSLIDFMIGPVFQTQLSKSNPTVLLVNDQAMREANALRGEGRYRELQWIPSLSAPSTRIIRRLWRDALKTSGKEIPEACLAEH